MKFDREKKYKVDELVKKIKVDIDTNNKAKISGNDLWEIIETQHETINVLWNMVEDLEKRVEKLEEEREIGLIIRK